MFKGLVMVVIIMFIFGCDSYNSPEIKESEYPGYYKICLDNHLYWVSYGSTESGIASILNDDGKPVKCKSEMYNK